MMPLNKTEQNIGAVISIFAIALLLIYIVFAIIGFNNEVTFLSSIGTVFLCTTVLCLVVVRKYRTEQNAAMIDYLNIGVQRYILAILMILYGVDKLLGNFFDYQLFALDSKLADVSEFQLTWFFYGKSHWQELFSGIMEFIPGLLLLPRRTYYIAAMILLPVTAQVFLLNFFFKIGGITLPAATILLACNLYILYSQKEKIILFFRSLDFSIVTSFSSTTNVVIKILRGSGLLLALLIIFFKLRPVVFKSSYKRKYESLVGVYTLQEIKRNHHELKPDENSAYYKDLYIEKQARWNILRRFDNKVAAFILDINTHNDSLSLFINKGGIGDDPDIIDSATVLKGVFRVEKDYLIIKGIQQHDTLELRYEKQARIKPKDWFW